MAGLVGAKSSAAYEGRLDAVSSLTQERGCRIVFIRGSLMLTGHCTLLMRSCKNSIKTFALLTEMDRVFFLFLFDVPLSYSVPQS